jgi:hypothetical protein
VDLHGLLGGMDTSFSGAHDRDIHRAGIANRAIYEAGSLQASQGTMEGGGSGNRWQTLHERKRNQASVALAAADDKASYEIGYYPENKKWDGKYRSIKVKIAQGDTQIRYRKGYFAFDTTQTKNVNYEQDVAAALQFNVPATQISFMAQAKPTDPGKVRVMFLVDAHTLTAENSGGN